MSSQRKTTKQTPASANTEQASHQRNNNNKPLRLPKSFMMGFAMLLVVCAVTVVWKYLQPHSTYATWASRIGQSFMYLSAGNAHFNKKMIPFYASMVPDFLPFKEAIVLVSGAIEILLGESPHIRILTKQQVLILLPPINNIAAWGIILLLIAIFPANLTALSPKVQAKTGVTPTIAIVRLPIQLLFIYWAYQLTTLSLEDTIRTTSLQGEVSKLMKLTEGIL